MNLEMTSHVFSSKTFDIHQIKNPFGDRFCVYLNLERVILCDVFFLYLKLKNRLLTLDPELINSSDEFSMKIDGPNDTWLLL